MCGLQLSVCVAYQVFAAKTMTTRTQMAIQIVLLSLCHKFVQSSDTCSSSVMRGIGLGTATTNMIHQNVSTIEHCRNLCCKKRHICASWTLSLEENTCLLRKEHEPTVQRNLNEISGVTKRDGMSTPHRNKKLRFYIGILSAPNNVDRVHRVRVGWYLCSECDSQELFCI